MAVAAAAIVASCGRRGNANEPLAGTGRTQRTENLLANLKTLPGQGFMFGHEDDPVYGIGWVGDSARSDVRSVCGDSPAVVGFDLGRIELGDSVNLDGVPFSRIREEAIRHFGRGGVVSLSWHANNPLTGGTAWVNDSADGGRQAETVAAILKDGETHDRFVAWTDRVADFISSLVTPYGVKVPVLFRPWHEHTGSWFWWGQDLCTADEYCALWSLTRERFRQKGVTNVLWAYSPGADDEPDAEKYLERYPGDESVDLLGLDCYCFAEPGDTAALASFSKRLGQQLAMLCRIGRNHDKPVALTETGYEGLRSSTWWTQTLLPAIGDTPICYVLVWRNAHDKKGHFYAPYPGQQSASDFVRFYNDRRTLFLRDVNALYLKKEKKKD